MSGDLNIIYAIIGGLGATELLVIFAILLLIFGGKKLPEVARSIGSALRTFKQETHELKREIDLEAEPEPSETPEAHEKKTQAPQASSSPSSTSPSQAAGSTSQETSSGEGASSATGTEKG